MSSTAKPLHTRLLSYLFEVLKIGFAVGLFWYLIHSGRIDVNSLKNLLSPGMATAGILCVGVTLFLASERWRVLLRQQKTPITSWLAFRLTLIGTFFNFFVPGGVGGDLVKAFLVAREKPQEKGRIALTVLADRILGLFTMVLLALVAFAFAIPFLVSSTTAQIMLGFLAITTLGFAIGFWVLFAKSAAALRVWIDRRLSPWPHLRQIWEVLQSYRLNGRETVEIVLLSLGGQVLQILLFVLVASTLGPLPPLSVFFFAVPLGFMITAIPIAPNGVGIGQAAFLYLFSQVLGTESNIGSVGITAFQGYQICYGVLGALFFVLLRRGHPELSLKELEKADSLVSEG